MCRQSKKSKQDLKILSGLMVEQTNFLNSKDYDDNNSEFKLRFNISIVIMLVELLVETGIIFSVTLQEFLYYVFCCCSYSFVCGSFSTKITISFNSFNIYKRKWNERRVESRQYDIKYGWKMLVRIA